MNKAITRFPVRLAHALTALFVTFCLLAPSAAVVPVSAAVADKKGEKNFKRGLEYEAAQQWEKAAQEFAFAVAAKPSSTEYQLHYRRALFYASQTLMQQGRALAEREDYVGAYNAFRQAYAYDSVNQLALAEMERMVRLQREKTDAEAAKKGNGVPVPSAPRAGETTARRIPAAYTRTGSAQSPNGSNQSSVPGASEPLRVIDYRDQPLESIIRSLADQLNLNVVFDQMFSASRGKQPVPSFQLKGVTAAQALDILFQSQNLFFQRLGRRTILVADAMRRAQIQQLAVRTFYLKNAKPADVQKVIQTTFQGPINPVIVPSDATNSLTVRTTPENMRIIENVVRSLDKERAAVVMDVQIYEVSRSELRRLGSQLGTSDTLGNFGRTSGLGVTLGAREVAERALATAAGASTGVPTALGAAILVPPVLLSALQSSTNARTLASTQLHAFDGQESTTNIGRRVPIQTGAIGSPFGLGVPGTGGAGTNSPVVNTGVFGGFFPQINYEQVGLKLSFKPQVFPNQDVEVEMKIEQSEVDGSAGGEALTPVVSNRQITGKARIQNNRTMMLASIAQNRQTDGREGIPYLGSIPIIGRLFSTPRTESGQSDIIIAVTPRVLSAPSIKPSDEENFTVGSQTAPANDSLAVMVDEVEREEQLARAESEAAATTEVATTAQAATTGTPSVVSTEVTTANAAATQNANVARALPVNNSAVPNASPAARTDVSDASTSPAISSAPNRGALTYVPAPKALIGGTTASTAGSALPAGSSAAAKTTSVASPSSEVKTEEVRVTGVDNVTTMYFVPNEQVLHVGERRQVMLMLQANTDINMVVASLRFDPRVIALRNVALGNLWSNTGEQAPTLSQSVGEGVLLASLVMPKGVPLRKAAGVLLVLEVEGIAAGASGFTLISDNVHLVAADGKPLAKQATGGRVYVTEK